MGLTDSSCCGEFCDQFQSDISTASKHRERLLPNKSSDYNIMESKHNAKRAIFCYIRDHERTCKVIVPDEITQICVDYFLKIYISKDNLHQLILDGSEHVAEALIEDLPPFIRTLPPKSKQHIWEHAVKRKTHDGRKQVCDETQNEKHINKLLCDWIIVYVKYLDRKKAPLNTKKVRPYVENISHYIYEKYHPIKRDTFENDKGYFADMVEEYTFNSHFSDMVDDYAYSHLTDAQL
eukprot:378121_1